MVMLTRRLLMSVPELLPVKTTVMVSTPVITLFRV